MKYLGIDYGDKRVGLAVSDDTGVMAFPRSVLENSKNLIVDILTIVKDEKIDTIIIGESLDFGGKPNAIMKNINHFVEDLKEKTKSGVNIIFEPEFLTSVQAEKIQSKNGMHDASAAAIILQSFLDKSRLASQ